MLALWCDVHQRSYRNNRRKRSLFLPNYRTTTWSSAREAARSPTWNAPFSPSPGGKAVDRSRQERKANEACGSIVRDDRETCESLTARARRLPRSKTNFWARFKKLKLKNNERLLYLLLSISLCSHVDQQITNLVGFGTKFCFVARSLVTIQCVVQNFTN